jgi:glycosyltransferase involved in cell wall biosynthesis
MPFFSLLTPVFNTPIHILEQCIESVRSQTFEDWELILVDDCSSDADIRYVLTQASISDSRIRTLFREENGGIAKTSQDALDHAEGTFIALLDHDDQLHHEALEKVKALVDSDPQLDYVYTDEDKIDDEGRHFDAFLKPDWSPERLRGQNYCCHLSVIRTSLARTVGGFRREFEGSQDYDLILRVTESARLIGHVPEVLYHWRSVTGSTAHNSEAKPYAYRAAEKALAEHLSRCGIEGDVVDAGYGYHRIVRSLTHSPLVSIIIPTCGAQKIVFGQQKYLIHNTLKSLFDSSTYKHIEVIVVADRHTPTAALTALQRDFAGMFSVVWYDKPFNFSDKCNLGFVHSRGDLIMFLNDDIEVITPDWLETLIPLALEKDVGLVGPMLLLEDGRIQSASHSNTPSPHNFRSGHTSSQGGEFGILAVARECSGVTGAAALLRRDVYRDVGGLSVQFPNCFNDVDFAFKILGAGYRIIWTPHARLYHFESVSRDSTVDKKELDLLMDRWGRYFDYDRFNRLN